MAISKPSFLNWGNVGTSPSDLKKNTGWIADEKPPHEYFNWAFSTNDKWHKYLLALAGYDFSVGENGTHDTFLSLFTGATSVPDSSRILIRAAQTIHAPLIISKNNLHIEFHPSAIITAGSAAADIEISGELNVFKNIHLLNFTRESISFSGDKNLVSDYILENSQEIVISGSQNITKNERFF